MGNFLSNERKVILKSAGAGVGIISLLSLVILTEYEILLFLAVIGTIAVYWCIPTWFSRSRQLEKREITPLSLKENMQSIPPEYRYFNAEGEEVRILSDRERSFSFILYIIVNITLIFFIYPKLTNILIYDFSMHLNNVKYIWAIFTLGTPYIIRHIYCSSLNRPMDTSLAFKDTTTPYIHKFDNRSSQSYNFATNPIYSRMPSNQYHYRHK